MQNDSAMGHEVSLKPGLMRRLRQTRRVLATVGFQTGKQNESFPGSRLMRAQTDGVKLEVGPQPQDGHPGRTPIETGWCDRLRGHLRQVCGGLMRTREGGFTFDRTRLRQRRDPRQQCEQHRQASGQDSRVKTHSAGIIANSAGSEGAKTCPVQNKSRSAIATMDTARMNFKRQTRVCPS